MQRKFISALILTTSSILSLEAMAAGDPPSSSRPAPSRPRNPVDRSATDIAAATFHSFDTDKDGYISRDEAKESPELTRRFNELDKDGDGRLSLEELLGRPRKAKSR